MTIFGMRPRAVGQTLAAVVFIAAGGAPLADAATFTVTNTATSGAGSLRDAVGQANVDFAADVIAFAIPHAAGEVAVIAEAANSAAYVIEGPTIIDGTTNDPSTPLGVIDVELLDIALVVDSNATHVTFRGLGMSRRCIMAASPITVEGSRLTDCATAIDLGPGTNGSQIGGADAGAGNVIGRNVAGVDDRWHGAVTYYGNTFGGVDAAGDSFTNVIGIHVEMPAQPTIGGSQVGEGNLIVSEASSIAIDGPSDPTGYVYDLDRPRDGTIQGNLIGTDPTGNAPAAAHQGDGMTINAGSHLIGGSGLGEGNTIGGSVDDAGIRIGGTHGPQTVIVGNHIGVGRDGVTPVPNRDGILASARVRIGGTAPGEANIIAFNGANGVLASQSGVAILGNAIHDNAEAEPGLGIAIPDPIGGTAPPGTPYVNPLPDFPGDIETRPERALTPELITTSTTSAGTTVKGAFTDDFEGFNTVPREFRIELFESARCNPAGAGEGQRLLRSFTLDPKYGQPDGGPRRQEFIVPDLDVAADHVITATATVREKTNPDNEDEYQLEPFTGFMATSEFSACAPAAR